jgi:hypothetical protein
VSKYTFSTLTSTFSSSNACAISFAFLKFFSFSFTSKRLFRAFLFLGENLRILKNISFDLCRKPPLKYVFPRSSRSSSFLTLSFTCSKSAKYTLMALLLSPLCKKVDAKSKIESKGRL